MTAIFGFLFPLPSWWGRWETFGDAPSGDWAEHFHHYWFLLCLQLPAHVNDTGPRPGEFRGWTMGRKAQTHREYNGLCSEALPFVNSAFLKIVRAEGGVKWPVSTETGKGSKRPSQLLYVSRCFDVNSIRGNWTIGNHTNLQVCACVLCTQITRGDICTPGEPLLFSEISPHHRWPLSTLLAPEIWFACPEFYMNECKVSVSSCFFSVFCAFCLQSVGNSSCEACFPLTGVAFHWCYCW